MLAFHKLSESLCYENKHFIKLYISIKSLKFDVAKQMHSDRKEEIGTHGRSNPKVIMLLGDVEVC